MDHEFVEGLEDNSMTDGFICHVCGQRHPELPMDFGADAPMPYIRFRKMNGRLGAIWRPICA